jgi:hypothetical protein
VRQLNCDDHRVIVLSCRIPFVHFQIFRVQCQFSMLPIPVSLIIDERHIHLCFIYDARPKIVSWPARHNGHEHMVSCFDSVFK